MSDVDSLITGLELDCFDNPPSIELHETHSEIKALVLNFCYGRGKPKAEISIPRLPKGVPARIVIPDVDLRQLLPTRKRAGRGRARFLSHYAEDGEPPEKTPVGASSVRPVPPKKSLFELPIEDPVCHAVYPGATADVDSFDYYVSDEEEDEGYGPLLPSQRGIFMHPFGKPPKPKETFNVKSADDFPTLGTSAPDTADTTTNTNITTRSCQFFPPLPPRLSKKVTNIDIVFKPMKEKKSKKKRKSGDTSKIQRQVSESDSVVSGESEQVCIGDDVDADGSVCCDQNGSVTGSDSTVQSELVLDDTRLPPLDIVKTPGDSWQTEGPNVIQIDGLPEDISGMDEIVSGYGKVLNFEAKILQNGKTSVRVKYDEADSSEYAISCLHGADGFLPDTVLQCYMVASEEG